MTALRPTQVLTHPWKPSSTQPYLSTQLSSVRGKHSTPTGDVVLPQQSAGPTPGRIYSQRNQALPYTNITRITFTAEGIDPPTTQQDYKVGPPLKLHSR